MPARPKLPQDKVGHHSKSKVLPATLVSPRIRDQVAGYPDDPRVPRPAITLPNVLRNRWIAIWLSPLAQLMDPVTDLPAFERLFLLYKLSINLDRRIAAANEAALGKLVEEDDDSQEAAALIAQVSAAVDSFNTTVGLRVSVAREVRMIEMQLGMSPRARLGLGYALKEATGGKDPRTAEADIDGEFSFGDED